MERVFTCNKKINGTEEQWLAIDDAVKNIVSADTKKRYYIYRTL